MKFERIKVENLLHFYNKENKILNNISFQLKRNEIILIKGKSGIGKTTLLFIISGLIKPISGKVFWDDIDIYKEKESYINRIRAVNIGFIFDNFRLAYELTGEENILLPAILKKQKIDKNFIEKLKEICFTEFELNKKLLSQRVKNMSRGQQERIAIARAFVLKPNFIIADEFLHSVDPDLKFKIWNEIKQLLREENIGFIFSSHDNEIINDSEINIKFLLKNGTLEKF